MTATLPKHLTLRPPKLEDAGKVFQLLHDYSLAEYGEPETKETDMLDAWNRPGFELEHDAWVIETASGEIIAYAALDEADVDDDAVHPDYRGQELELILNDRLEARLREKMQPGQTARLKRWVNGMADDRVRLFTANGYVTERHFYRMTIDLPEAPPAFVLPSGLTIRPYVPGQDDRQVYDMRRACFADSWDFRDLPLEQWIEEATRRSNFDPALWHIAEQDGQPAGHALNLDFGNFGFIGNLAVLPQFRRRGIARALLQHSFADFYSRGKNKVSLGVDAANPTGATELYLAVGMRQTRHFICMKKDVRA